MEVALSAAAVRCAAADERLTAARRRVLQMLLESSRPRKAYDLIANFGKPRDRPKPTTIYRALEFLIGQGLVHRIESTNSFVACRRSGQAHSAGFLICDCCGTVEEFEVDVLSSQTIAEAKGYTFGTIVLEALGLCRACLPPSSVA